MTKIFALVGAFILSMTPAAFSQQTQSFAPVFEECRAVALAELQEGVEGNPLRGRCIAATSNYLAVVLSSGAPPAVIDQTISDLVVSLTTILFTPQCVTQSEVAQAIDLTADSAVDDQQAAQIRLISQTLNRCEFVITASILTTRDNSFSSSSSTVSGTQASQN